MPPEFSVPQATQWVGWNVPVYLFLSGTAAGCVLVAAFADLLGGARPRFQHVARLSLYVFFLTILVAGLAIVTHLSRPEKGLFFVFFFTNFRSSWMVWGAWMTQILVTLSAVMVVLWYFGWAPWLRRLLALVAIPLAVGVATYTGLLLSGSGMLTLTAAHQIESHPMWLRSHLPLMFLASGVSSGLALVGLALLLTRNVRRLTQGLTAPAVVDTVALLAILLGIVVLIDLVGATRYVADLQNAPPHRQGAYRLLSASPWKYWYWVGVVGVGLVVPLAVAALTLIVKLRRPALFYLQFVCVLVGMAALRFVVVYGGAVAKAGLKFPAIPPAPPF